jgi:hypothetical protein
VESGQLADEWMRIRATEVPMATEMSARTKHWIPMVGGGGGDDVLKKLLVRIDGHGVAAFCFVASHAVNSAGGRIRRVAFMR